MAAEEKTQVEFVEVKAEDILSERRRVYDSMLTGIKVAIVGTVLTLVGIYLFFG